MTCDHCCFACTSRGTDMSPKTYRNAIKFASERGDIVSLGGGEPTVHPRFWEILGLAMGSFDYVWLATNGKKTETALALAGLAKKGAIACRLSLDDYHDEIDSRVEEAFSKNSTYNERGNDYREISRGAEAAGKNLVNSGRCDWGDDECACEDTFILPNGDIKPCGCLDAPVIGNVNDGINVDLEDWDDVNDGDCCWKKHREYWENLVLFGTAA